MNSEKLKSFCRNIGLKYVGIAGVGPYDNLERIIKNKLSNGHFTGMEEEVIEKRINPKLIMENAESIIVCAFPYYTGEYEDSNLSKYCYGKDYHLVAKDYLQKICDYLSEEINNFEYKYFVDNGPLVDRHLAYLAGIGYFGINNNIITDKYGSYIFIAYVVNNYEFEPDKPSEKSCLKCNKCVKYCPGNAILGNFEIDPRKCLSYITQKKEELSESEIQLLKENGKVFGCDICQDVCPHNKDIQTTKICEFNNELITKINQEEIDEISNKEFKRRYKNRAFSWRGRKIIKRNLDIISDKNKMDF